MEFVKIKAGKFLMGSPESDKNRFDDENQHEVEITEDFEIGKYQVTQKEWTEVMKANPSSFVNPNNPVENVSWDDAQEFIQKMNDKNDGYTYRLPTEAEWEYACGETPKNIDAHAWYYKNSDSMPHPVGEKLPNKNGLYDMLGNVWEWTMDWYGPYETNEKP
jgi:formylglycine-generating enzyme required for sulfatase activity